MLNLRQFYRKLTNFSLYSISNYFGDGGEAACNANIGEILGGSCLGEEACSINGGDIGNDSCIGAFACYRNEGDVNGVIGRGSW